MSTFDVSAACIDLSLDLELDDLSIIFPGGVELKIPSPPSVDVAFAIDYGKQILAAVNAALMPLQPIFNIIDVLLAIYEFAKAVPDAITSLDPGKIIEAIPNLAKKLDKVLAMIPPLSIPIFVKTLLRAILVFLRGLRASLVACASLSARLDAGKLRVGELEAMAAEGKIDAKVALSLEAAIDCASASLDAVLAGLFQGAMPLNSILGLIRMFVEMIGLPVEIPLMAEFNASAGISVAIDGLDVLILLLSNVRAAIVI